jgi:hypothetical protein
MFCVALVGYLSYWTLLKYGYFTMLKPSPVKSTKNQKIVKNHRAAPHALLAWQCAYPKKNASCGGNRAETSRFHLQMCLDIHMFFL